MYLCDFGDLVFVSDVVVDVSPCFVSLPLVNPKIELTNLLGNRINATRFAENTVGNTMTQLFKRLLLLVCCTSMGACGHSLSTTQLSPEDELGLVALKVINIYVYPESDEGKPLSEVEPSFALSFNGLNAEQNKFVLYGSNFGLHAFESQGASPYVFAKVKPGTYALRAMHGGGVEKSACLHDGTLKFDVQPGTVTLLGSLDRNVYRHSLIASVKNAKQKAGWMTGDFVYGEGVITPEITPPSADLLEEFRSFLVLDRPDVTAPVSSTELIPTTIQHGNTIYGDFNCN